MERKRECERQVRRILVVVSALALVLGWVGPAAGQENPVRLRSVGQVESNSPASGFGLATRCETVLLPSRECIRAVDATAAASARRAPDHRYEGLAIGAGVGAIGFGLLGAALCSASSDDTDDCTGVTIKSGLLGAALGGLTGLLIGGAFPKQPRREPADSAR